MRNRDNDLVFRMYDVPCGTCHKPASWYVNGVMLPCGCGSTGLQDRADARKRAREHHGMESAR